MCAIPAHSEVYSILLVNGLRHFCVSPSKIKMTAHERHITDNMKVRLSTHNPFMACRGTGGYTYVPIYYLEINVPFTLLVGKLYLIFSYSVIKY